MEKSNMVIIGIIAILVTLIFFQRIPSPQAKLSGNDEFITGQNDFSVMSSDLIYNSTRYVVFVFRPQQNFTLRKLSFRSRVTANQDFTTSAVLRKRNSDGTNTQLCTGTTSIIGSSMTNVWANISFTLPTTVLKGGEYEIAYYSPDGNTIMPKFTGSPNNPYADGYYYAVSSSGQMLHNTSGVGAAYDIYFRMYGTPMGSGGGTCDTAADTNCDNCVSRTEFSAYASRWINNQGLSFADMMTAAGRWVNRNHGVC